jgi:hypothetical protein
MDNTQIVGAIVTEVTDVLTIGGKADISVAIEGFTARVSVEAQIAPATPVLKEAA